MNDLVTTVNADITPLNELTAEVQKFVTPVFSVKKITNEEDKKLAIQSGKQLKDLIKQVGSTRKSITDPMRAEIDRAMSVEKSLLDPLEKGVKHLSDILLKYNIVLEQQKKAELEKIAAAKKLEDERLARERQAQKDEAETLASFGLTSDAAVADAVAEINHEINSKQVAKAHKTNVKAVTNLKVTGVRQNWKARVVDSSKVPEKYKDVVNSRLMEDFGNGIKEIPGVEFYQESGMSFR